MRITGTPSFSPPLPRPTRATSTPAPPAAGDRVDLAGPGSTPSGVKLATIAERLAVVATLPATFLPAPLFIEQSVTGTAGRFEGLTGELTPELDPQGRMQFRVDPLGPLVIYDPRNRDFGLATPVERDNSGLLYRKYEEIFHADGSRTILRDHYSEPAGDGRSYLRVDEAADGTLSASQVLERGGKRIEEIPLRAQRLDSQVYHDIQLLPGSMRQHVRANGLKGLLTWTRRGGAMFFFEPWSERPGTRFPLLDARIELGGDASVPSLPTHNEPEPSPYRDQLKIRLLEDRVQIGAVELPRRNLDR
ncbi:MAG: hypothetical protein HY319_25705 [Armatimonadetes bacterium]|nr:hypothetical protein [Armatimonadota bacterium]